MGETADVWVADRVVPPENHRKDAALLDVGDRLIDLIEALLDVRRDHADVADIDHVEGFDQVHAQLEVVAGVLRRDRTHRLRSPACARAERRAGVEWHAEHGDILAAKRSHVFQKRRAQVGSGVGEAPRAAPIEEGNRAVADRLRRLETQFERAFGPFFTASG